MLKSSEFNSAVPKFTNGNYANNPLDPTNIEEPTMQDYVRGVEPLETLPAQWWNWLCNQFTSRFNKLNTYVKNIFDELTQLLSLVNVTPDGTESTITTGQLKNAFKELYPTYVSNKLALGTTYVKRTQKVNNHALTGDVTITKSDVGLGNVVNTGDSAVPVSGGTTKFTTGGAYTELAKKQNNLTFDTTPTKGSTNPVTSNGIYGMGYRYVNNSTSSGSSMILKITITNGNFGTFIISSTGNDTVIGSYTSYDFRWSYLTRLVNRAVKFPSCYMNNNGKELYINVDRWSGHKEINLIGGNVDFTVTEVESIPEEATQLSIVDISTTVAQNSKDLITSGGVYSRFGNVVNTGDSATPVQGGTTKFTTGGAYTELAKKLNITDEGNVVYNTDITDCNNAYEKGKTRVYDLINVDNLPVAGVSWYVLSMCNPSEVSSNDYITQIATPANNSTRNELYIRHAYIQNSTVVWTYWKSLSNIFVDTYSFTRQAVLSAPLYLKLYEYTTAQPSYFSQPIHLQGDMGYISSNLKTEFDVFVDFRVANTNNGIVVGQSVRSVSEAIDIIPTWDSSTGTARVYIAINARYAYCRLQSSVKLLSPTEESSMLGTSGLSLSANATILENLVPKTTTINGHSLSYNVTVTKSDVGLDSVVNTGDSDTPVSGGTTKFTTGGAYTELAKKVDKTTTVNGHTLSNNVTVTKSDVGLGSVVNTGDSTTPNSGGTTKFTTGGAYNLLTSLAPIFSTTTSYAVGDMVTYSGRLYTCTTAHSAGAWNASHFTVNDFNSFYNFTNGAKDSKTWLTKLFSRTIGNSWTDSLSVETSGSQYGVAYGKGVWVIASQRGTFWSENLTDWTAITGVNSASNTIEFKDGVFVLGTSHTGVWWSEDGKSYTLATGISNSITVHIKHVGELWFASSENDAWWSENGKSWTTCVGTTNGISLSALDYGDGKYFASKNNNTNLITSSDGKSWSSVASSYFNNKVTAVKYAKGVWFVGTDRDTFDQNLFTSKDGGTTWNVETMVRDSSMYVTNIQIAGNIAIIEYYDPNHFRTTFIVTFGLDEENSCIIRSTKIEGLAIISLVQVYGTYFAFTIHGGLMRSTDLLIWEDTFVRASSSGVNKILFADNKLLYTSQLDGAQFSEIDLNAI